MAQWKTWLFWLALVFPLLLLVCLWVAGGPLLTITLEALASGLLQAEVSLEAAHLSVSTLHLRGITIEHFPQGPLQHFSSSAMVLQFHPLELLQGKIKAVNIHHPVIVLTLSTPSETPSPPSFSIEMLRKILWWERFALEGGRVEWRSPDRQFGLTHLTARLAFSPDRKILHFSLRGSTFPEIFPLTIESRLDLGTLSPQGELSLSLPALPLPLLAFLFPRGVLPPEWQLDGTAQLQLSAQVQQAQFFGEMQGKLAAFTVGFPGRMTPSADQHFTLHFSGSLQDRQPIVAEAVLTIASLGSIRLRKPLLIQNALLPDISLLFQLTDLQALEPFLTLFAPDLTLRGKGEGTIEVNGQEGGRRTTVEARFLPLQVDWKSFTLPLASLLVQVTMLQRSEAHTIPLTGTVEGKFQQGESLLLTWNALYTAAEERWHLSPLLVTLSPQEKVSVEGQLTQPFSPQAVVDLTYNVSSFSLLQGKKLLSQIMPTLSLPAFQGTVATKGTLNGPLSRLTVEGKGSMKGGKMETEGFTAQGAFSGVEYHLQYPMLTFAIQSLTGEVHLRKQKIPSLFPLAMAGQGTLDLSTLTYTLRRGTIQVGKEEAFTVSAQGTLSPPQSHTFSVQAVQWKIGRVWGRLQSQWLPEYQGWVGEGVLAFQGQGKIAESTQGYAYTLTTQIKIQQGGFQSPDGTKAMANLETTLEANLKGALPIQTVHFRMQGSAGNFETLFGEFGEIYASFPGKFLQFDIDGRYESGHSPRVHLQGTGNLEEVSKVSFAGTLSPYAPQPVRELSLEVTISSLETLYQRYIFAAFQTTFPLLHTLQIAGESKVKVGLQADKEDFRLTGSLGLQKGRVQWQESKVEIHELAIALPFTLRFPSPVTTRAPAAQDYGTLSFHTLLLPSFTLSDISLQLAVVDNVLTLKERLLLPLFGGEITLAQVRFAHPFSAQRQLTGALQLKHLDLHALTKTYGPVSIMGTLQGSFPRIWLQGDKFHTEGEIEINAFGGSIKGLDITGDNLFSAIPSFHVTLLGKGLNLAEITKTFGFGLIQGTLDCYLYDLEMVNGQPQSFEAVLETVEQPGQDQRISIDAIENLTTLEGGSGSFLDKSFYGFFQEYSYEKIGIWAKLRTDTFFLRGTLQRGEQELFLKGKGLPRLDIVNHAPPQGISFKEMVQRLQRIGAAGSPTSPKH